ncbi:MAG: TIGR02587 family membrane protein [Armatimonadota bacterium]
MVQAAAAGRGREHEDRYGWREEGQSLLRAVAGGTIVGIPLLYTMEMWWHGMTLSAWHLLAVLGAIVAVNFVFSLFSGFRQEFSVREALSESLTAVGVGLVLATLVLAAVGELSWSQSPKEWIGKILLEAAAVSVGVSFANAQVLGKDRTGDSSGDSAEADSSQGEPENPERKQLYADLKDAGATLAGATVFALNIAPTEEVFLIATRLAPWHQLALLGLSVVLVYVILFASGFEKHEVYVKSLFQHPWAETAMVGAISLSVAGGLLWMLGTQGVFSHPATAAASVVTLGLPAMVGGAAGRLVL